MKKSVKSKSVLFINIMSIFNKFLIKFLCKNRLKFKLKDSKNGQFTS